MWQAVARAVLVVSVSGRDDVEAVAQALCVQEGLDEDDVEIIADGLYRHLDDTGGGGGCRKKGGGGFGHRKTATAKGVWMVQIVGIISAHRI